MGRKGDTLSEVSLVSAVEWPAYELVSGRTVALADGVAGIDIDDFYAQFAPRLGRLRTCTNGDHTPRHTRNDYYQARLRYAAAEDTYYTDATFGIPTTDEIPLGTAYWLLPAVGAETVDGDDWGALSELRLPIDHAGMTGDHKFYRSIRQLLADAHTDATIVFNDDFSAMPADEPSTGFTASALEASPTTGDTYTAMKTATTGVLDKAAAIAAELDCADKVADAISARERRTRPEHLRAMGKLRAAMGRSGQVFTTQFAATLLSAETDRLGEIADFEQRVVLGAESYRKQLLQSVADQIVGLHVSNMAWKQELVRTALYADTARIASEHDKWELDAQGRKANALWDLEIYDYAWQAISVLNGAPLVARPMTQNQRIAAAVTNGMSAGLQVGASTGNIAIGALVGVAATAAQLWGMA